MVYCLLAGLQLKLAKIGACVVRHACAITSSCLGFQAQALWCATSSPLYAAFERRGHAHE